MSPDRVSNPGPLTYESGALPIAQVISLLTLSARGEKDNFGIIFHIYA